MSVERNDMGIEIKIFLILISLCLIILIYNVVIIFVSSRNKGLSYYNYSMKEWSEAFDYLYKDYTDDFMLTKKEYKELIDKDTKLFLYFYKEKIIDGTCCGKTYPTIRLIVLDKRLSEYEYCVVYAHESIHLSKMIMDERYVSFETFKYLINSDNPYLKMAGKWYGIEQLHYKYHNEYSCVDLIIEYIENNFLKTL